MRNVAHASDATTAPHTSVHQVAHSYSAPTKLQPDVICADESTPYARTDKSTDFSSESTSCFHGNGKVVVALRWLDEYHFAY